MDVWAIIASSIVALLIGWLGAWATLRSANPKRRLNWWVTANTPLIASPRGSSGSITVNAAGIQIAEPRIVEFAVANTGRRDITSSMFHNGESFVFDLGIPIVTILALESTPQGSMHPAINFPPTERGRFEIEPSHIAQQQVTVFTLLVDGEERAPHCLRKPLVDVQVVPEAPGAVADRAIDLFLEMYGPRSRSAAQRP